MLLSVIDELQTNTLSKVHEIRVSNFLKTDQRFQPSSHLLSSYLFSASQDVMGFNSAALQFLKREIESKEDVMFFADATGKLNEKKKRRRKREHAILTIA